MKKDNVKRTVMLAVLGSISLMPLLVLPVMVGSFVDHMALSDSEAGYVASAGFLGGALAAIFISLRIHHVDMRRMAYVGLGLMVLADGGSIAAAHLNFWLFVVLRFFSGIGGAAAYASVMGSYAGWREPDRAYGLFMAMQFAFSAAGLYGLPWILPETGVAGILVLFTVLDILALFLVTQLPTAAQRRGTTLKDKVEWRAILAATSLLCLFGIGLFEAANMANFTYADRIGISFGLAGEQIGLVLGVATVLGIPAGFGVYFVGSRFGRFSGGSDPYWRLPWSRFVRFCCCSVGRGRPDTSSRCASWRRAGVLRYLISRPSKPASIPVAAWWWLEGSPPVLVDLSVPPLPPHWSHPETMGP